ncbi:Eisosome protein 1 [Penicillium expansum]|uniref:Eisosome protein 1 n=1 Tax=Penicillium expansum TaxID=27334 RepID=A0A0A2KAD6_PENEN|nr:Eisosome protein 1 [Penicillium expansum]KGO39076.1 Eisosome protein 1 [Penicillium expansum]KGO49397.1 Eisosome protein 1 [Penicillium expansum]KGO63873.1 Eisosome protein 1 [Penicillium expansum]
MATVQVTRQSRLADDAATAALYVTHPKRRASLRAPTATNTQDFNSRAVGGTPNLSHASAASALAHANRKPVEVWRPPTRQPAAEKAALCVKDYTPPQQPQPATGHSAEGLGAAMIAVREQRASVGQAPTSTGHRRGSSATDRYHHTAVGGNPKDKALQAATGAYTLSRKRADSAPSDPGVTSELSFGRAAAGASRYARVEEEGPLDHLDPAMEASRLQHAASTNPKLYTSSPPVQCEIEEQNYKNSQRAAAISMAKDMYRVTSAKNQSGQSPAILAAQKGQSQLGYRKTVSTADGAAVRRAIALQEAAQKRAAEKLALMQDEQVEYQQYYGTAPQPQRSRLTTRRKRTSSDADASQIDAEQSRQIRSQMTSLQTKLDQVDVQKTRDRELLMQAARRNVDQTLQDMEAQLYANTGRAPPSVQKGWDEVAQERVRREAEDFEATTAQGNRVNIGGQKYMDIADIDAVARSRLQPTFDEITENAELRRAHDIEARLDAEEEQRHAAVERQREAEVKELEKQEKGASKRDSRSESKVPKFFLWRKKGKRARVEKSETEEAQAVSPIAQGAIVEPLPTTAPYNNVSTESIPEQASIETGNNASTVTIPDEGSVVTETAGPETAVAAISSVPETELSKAGEDDVPAAIPRRPIRSQTELPQIEQRDAAASGPPIVHYFTPPVSSPRADTKLKNWFRDRLVRRSSGPVPIYPHQPGPDSNTDNEPAFQGGASLTGRDESRGVALGSHPLGVGEPIPTHNRSSSYYSNDFDVAKINSAESLPKSTKQNGNGKKRNRLSKTFLRAVSRSPDGSNDGDSRRDSGIQSSSKDVRSGKIQSLQDSTIGQSLPVPPTIGETLNGRRESRFSENL